MARARYAVLFLLLAPLLAAPAKLRSQSAADSGVVAPPPPPPGDSVALVVLVHGMGRTSLSMLPLQRALERSGYRVLNFHYSSYGPSVERIGTRLARSISTELRERPAPRVHFVGHSLGNIVLRWVLAHRPPRAELGRFVMLAPPNQGAHSADRLAPYLGWLLAPISELRTEGSTVTELPPPAGMEFAIIAGQWDGKVSIPETCLPGARAHAVVPSGHTFIMMRPDVYRLVRAFLADGVLPDTTPASPCA